MYATSLAPSTCRRSSTICGIACLIESLYAWSPVVAIVVGICRGYIAGDVGTRRSPWEIAGEIPGEIPQLITGSGWSLVVAIPLAQGGNYRFGRGAFPARVYLSP